MSGAVDSTAASMNGDDGAWGKRSPRDEPVPERHDGKLDNETSHAAPVQDVSSVREGNAPNAGPSVLTNQLAAARNNAVIPAGIAVATSPLLADHRQPYHSPANAGLHIQTSLPSVTAAPLALFRDPPTIYETPVETVVQQCVTSSSFIAGMSSSLRSVLSSSSIASSLSPSPASALASPYLAAMTDLTPLPSPTIGAEPPTSWLRPRQGTLSGSRQGSLDDGAPPSHAPSVPSSPSLDSPQRRKKAYGGLFAGAMSAVAANSVGADDSNPQDGSRHARNRSISDFIPDQLQNMRQRHVTFGPGDPAGGEYHMHREANLAGQRGLTAAPVDPSKAPPSPPPSNTSVAESEDADDDQAPLPEDVDPSEYLHINCGMNNRERRFRQIRQLGQGTFSKVMLATRQRMPAKLPPDVEDHLDPHRVVAVKIVEHGPAGGADEERIETSLKREVEMLKSVSHPSLIHLKACQDQPTRTLLVLTYCPGGDLFEFASEKRDILRPAFVQRVFAELVGAVRYLHTHCIVHRDIKLENVLVNLSISTLRAVKDPLTFPSPIITLTDLGLSRCIPTPPESPLLTTRCGSEDYAAPEILLGQAYDGRLTDGWALGVLLYALMEGRLPFDAPPGKPDRSRNTHRIARCDWIWCRFGDGDGEWDPQRGADFEGGRLCVEALLKKVRMGRKTLEDIERMEWVQHGIQVPGGLRMREEVFDEI